MSAGLSQISTVKGLVAVPLERRQVLSLVPFLLFSCERLVADDNEWPWWRGPNHDGRSPDTGLQKNWPDGGPPLIWKAKGLGGGYSSPTVANRRIFVTGELQGKLTMSSLSFDGELLWQEPIDAECRFSPAGHEEPQQSMAIECTSFLETASYCA